ncbi:trypsin-like peptidase domain-containing protein [Aerophototrophica crusticola]|uniref:Trypsin-like peptidase domain-containing protein n=1 Tax=Aerophototrophica crusticola TaxID=1709002 RepID=A0A858RA55_9PROT|nr:trypsin-like peptidase domain-containing protein [Rhodospirillaceae bacterium B3]
MPRLGIIGGGIALAVLGLLLGAQALGLLDGARRPASAPADTRVVPGQAAPAPDQPRPDLAHLPEAELDVELAKPKSGFGGGSAFPVGPTGVVMTAAHVVQGCKTVFLSDRKLFSYRSVRVRSLDWATDLALLEADEPLEPLPMLATTPGQGTSGFHVGFPNGNPGVSTSSLLAWSSMEKGRRVEGTIRREPVLIWAERGRDPKEFEPLGGASGAPTLSADGQVIGVTLGASPRRGRIMAATPESVAALLAREGLPPPTDVSPATAEKIASQGKGLREERRVLKVICDRKEALPIGQTRRLRQKG